MSYTITRYNGSNAIIVPDGTVNSTLDVTLIGKNYAGYGQKQNENFVYLLENFANTSPPTKPIPGQLWYNSQTGIIKLNLFDGTSWKTLGVNSITTNGVAPTNGVLGDMWYDQQTDQLHVHNGAGYTLVGPQSVYGFNQTQLQSVNMQDAAGNHHPVQIAWNNGEIIFIISSDSVFVPGTPITGFTSIHPGVNINSANKIYGTVTNADTLGGNGPLYYAPLVDTVFPNNITVTNTISANGTLTISNNGSNVPVIKNSAGPNILFQTVTNGTTNTPLQLLNNNILPGSAGLTDIGATSQPFKNLYANYVFSIAQKADSLNLGGTYTTATTAGAPNTIVARDQNTNITAARFIGKADAATNADHALLADRATLADEATYADAVQWNNVIGKPTNFVFNDNNTTAWHINILGNSAGTHTGPVVGNVTGDTTGTHTGPVFGTVTGNVNGNITGTIHIASDHFQGNLQGNVVGNLQGNTAGTHTGPVVGNVTGNVAGNVVGNVTGNVTGNLYGNATSATNQSGGTVNATSATVQGILNVSAGSNAGIRFPNDAFGGSGDTATITLETKGSENTTLTLRVTNDPGDTIGLFAPSNDGVTINNNIVLHAANFNNYAPTLTGNNASGNWGINVTGTSSAITNSGTISAEANGTYEPSNELTLRSVYNNGYPTTYGNLITLGGIGGGELLIGWSGSTGAHADNFIRSRRDVAGVWSPWAKVITDANIGANFARVATTGSYTDLSNKPSIPAPVNIGSMNAALQNIVKTIVGTIDLYLTSNGGSGIDGVGYVGGGAGGGWQSSTSWNRTSATAWTGNTGGTITLIVDVAGFLGLSNDPNSLYWRGNYDFNVAPSMTRIYDARLTFYSMGNATWAVSSSPLQLTNRSHPDYGKFSISVTCAGDHYYHGSNVQAGWIGVGSRTNNVYTP